MTLLGKYELLTPLGEGATSEVYRARDTALGRDVALKILKPSLVADASAFERFAREAQAAAGLFHPNIATVLDMGTADGRYFIAMRYFEGKALDKVLREDGPLTWKETLRLLAQIGSALDHAHKKGFLHRDVKPGNIICDENGDFILTDFGLTRAMMSTGLTSHTGAVLGTPAYISPEVWNGEPAAPASDQYALVCVLYECLTGQMLFDGDTPLALMKKVFDGPQLPAVWPPGVPVGFGTVLQRALFTKPGERYPSLAAFEQACRELGAKPAVAPQKEEKALPAIVEKPLVEKAVPVQRPSTPPQAGTTPLSAQPVKKQSLAWVWWVVGVAGLVVFGCAGVFVFRVLLGSPDDAKVPQVLGIGSALVSKKDGMTLLYVPAGEFTMGSNDGNDDEKPVHTVTLGAFWIDQTEVTNAMYALCVKAGDCRPPQDTTDYGDQEYGNHPVVYVSWNDAKTYCEWAGRRLPTEPEWEKAARGTDGRTYPWGNQLPAGNLANFADVNLGVDWAKKSVNDGYQFTAPVGTYPAGASPYGALDMAGNVWEWTASWGDAYPGNRVNNDEYGTLYRVMRGGSWGDSGYKGDNLRVSDRGWNSPVFTFVSFGFRCARSSP